MVSTKQWISRRGSLIQSKRGNRQACLLMPIEKSDTVVKNGMYSNIHSQAFVLKFFFFLVAAFLLSDGRAQALETPHQAVQRALTAHGNKVNGQDIQDFTATGTVTAFGMGIPPRAYDLTLVRKGTTHMQRVIKDVKGEIRQGTDGSQEWVSYLSGRRVVAAPAIVVQFIESQTARSIQRLFNYQSEGLMLRDIETTQRGHTIEAEDRQGRKTNYTIDNGTSRITQIEFIIGAAKDAISGKPVSVRDTYRFSDFRPIQGVLTPFKIERYYSGMKTEEMTFRTAKYNSAVPTTAFRP